MALRARVAVVAITGDGSALARRIAAVLDGAAVLGGAGAEVHGLRGRAGGADVRFTETRAHLRTLFEDGRPVVGVCAAGILVRSVAPALDDKRAEPPVVAVSEDGAFVVPLLGGHRGGVELARCIADGIGAAAALTTAGDRRFGLALDSPPAGWTLANPEDCKPFVASLLRGARVRPPADLASQAPWLAASRLPFDDAGELAIRIDVASGDGGDGGASGDGAPDTLVYRPRRLAIGVGCERGAAPEEIAALARSCLSRAGLAPGAVAGVFSIDLKSDEPAVHALAESLRVPARFFPAAALEAEGPRLRNPSDVVFRAVGCHGVAEGAALAAAGPEGELIVEKTRSARGTCAIAGAPAPIDASSVGAPRGALAVVGVGPGDAGALTPEARAALERADHVVGYRRYLDLAARLVPGLARAGRGGNGGRGGNSRRAENAGRGAHGGGRGPAVHPYALGEERARAAKAIALAAGGERVALVCSGDPGVYAMASLVMEALDRTPSPASRRIEVRVVPGVSALQAAAARAGAPVGHDFCAVSLSDLLTPREVVEGRLAAAARADFVIALYNPVSAARRETFDRALRILGEHRRAETPVVVARNLGRPGERVDVVPLGAIDPERIDMMTVLIVGSSRTRTFAHGGVARAYTPRGYEVGAGAPERSTVRCS